MSGKLAAYETEHMEKLRKIAPECMVLLKNDGSFPLGEPGRIALYGNGARNTLKSGTGSGDVNVRHFTTIEEGLENAGFVITNKVWMDHYQEEREKAKKKFVEDIKFQSEKKKIPAFFAAMGAIMPEPEYDIPLDGEGDTAIYVLSRVSGEGSDRKVIPGDFLLTDTEVKDILTLERKYKKFMLVLNVGGVVDLSPVKDIKNILLLSQPGMTVGDSLADAILGKAYPSGKLATTWSAWEDYCSIGEFGQLDDTRYKEGIYVGYRYFDSVDKEPLFPFGYGLGYTDFEIKNVHVLVEEKNVKVSAVVHNIGRYPGKEVVQLYVSVPEGKLKQPWQTLAAFKKTEELQPGESKEYVVEFSMDELASYDTESASNIIEAGDYVLRIGNSSRNVEICGIVRLAENVLLKELKHLEGETDFEDWEPEVKRQECLEEKCFDIFVIEKEKFTKETTGELPEMEPDIYDLLKDLTDEQLAYLCLGNFRMGSESESIIGNAGSYVMGAAGESCDRFVKNGIPVMVMADGPAGLRLSKTCGRDEQGIYSLESSLDPFLMEFLSEEMRIAMGAKNEQGIERKGKPFYQYCSAIPTGTALAQSWNTEAAEICADIVGNEMERFGIQLWLAPALNIHRNVLCGRNFEYFSEDPLLSGKIAAAITKGVQSNPGCGVTLKHFACNNQETNRVRSNSMVNERALRDIYLKGFEIAVRESQPHSIMTSYNLLNGEHTSHRRDLNVVVLRKEWRFKGLVMSDWVISGVSFGEQKKYPVACASGSIKAGNDVFMPGSERDYQDLLDALRNPEHKYHITRENLLECASHVVRLARILKGEK